MIEFKKQLNEPAMVEQDEAIPRTKWMSDGIIKAEKRFPAHQRRTDEQIWQQTFNSVVCEIGIAKALKGSCNKQKFDKTIRQSYAYDVIVPGYQEDTMFEVKWMSIESEWYTFNDNVVNSIYKNKAYYDYLIVSSYVVEDGKYKVIPRFIFDPRTFHKNYKSSYYDNYKKYYYNHNNSDCIVLNKEKVLQYKQLMV